MEKSKVKSQKLKVENLYCVMRNALCDVSDSFERKTHNAKRITYITAIIMLTLFFFGFLTPQSPVHADGGAVDLNESFEVDDKFAIEDITISFFPQLGIGSEHFTVFSWLSLAGAIATLAIIGYWVFYILKAGVKAMRAQGNADVIQAAVGDVRAVFAAMFLSLLFPVLLNIAGMAFGLGPIWNWPLAFRACTNQVTQTRLDGTKFEIQYFYQAFALEDVETVQDAEAVCF